MGRRVKAGELKMGQWLRSCRSGWLYRVTNLRTVSDSRSAPRLVRVCMVRHYDGKDSRVTVSWSCTEFDRHCFETVRSPLAGPTTVFGKLAGGHP